MNSESSTQSVETRMQSVRRRIRRFQRRRGLLLTITVAMGGLIAVAASDFLLGPLPVRARVALSASWLVATLIAARIGFGPMLKPISLLQVARWLETRHPELQERISTALEIGDHHEGLPAGLVESLIRAADADAAAINVETEVRSARTSRQWGRPAVALAIVLVLAFVIWPHEASRLLVRAFSPFSDRGNAGAGHFQVKPGDIELLAGDTLHIETAYDGKGKNLELAMEFENGERLTQPLNLIGDSYVYSMELVKRGFRYRVRAGREESDAYKVTVWPMPEIVEPRVKLEFPAYTGVAPAEFPLENGISAVIGTKVTLSGKLNTAITAGWLATGERRWSEANIETAANGGRVKFEWQLGKDGSGEATAFLKHRLGRDIEAMRVPIQVLEDQAPEVVLIIPMQHELKLRPDDLLEMKYEVKDDFGLAKCSIEADTGGGRTILLDRSLPAQVPHSEPPRFRGEAPVAVGELRGKFPNAGTLRVRIRAEDGRPADIGGPGVGVSAWVILRIDNNAESLARQELTAEHEGARHTIEEAIQATREARDRMDWHRDQVKRNDLDENTRRDLKEAGEKLATAQENLEELAKRMEESVHATKADEVRKASEMVAQARENMENAPLQDQAQEREAKLQEAHNDAEAAIKQLENTRDAMDREREKIQDLARLQDLASQQRELARQAEENLAQNPQQQPKDWQDRQQQAKNELAQQLRERPDAKAEALKAQAAQAQALSEQAKQMAESQKQLGEQAAQPSAESLQEKLAKEQAEIAAEANAQLAQARQSQTDLADSLPEATAQAEAARDAMQNHQADAAAESAQKAAEAMKSSAAEAQTAAKEEAQSTHSESQQQGQQQQGQQQQGQQQQGQQQQGQQQQGQQQQGQQQQGQQQQGQQQQGQQQQGQQPAQLAAQAEALNDLAQRQEQVAKAMESLAKGDANQAMKQMQASEAADAQALAKAIQSMPQVDESGYMNDAKSTSSQGGEQANQAAQKGEQGQQGQAAQQHEQSGQNFAKSAQSLQNAAQEFAQAAQQAAAQQSNSQKAAAPAANMAEAFQQAAQAAANPQGAEAAMQAQQAAQALGQAAQAAREQMQGGRPGERKPGMKPGSQPGDKPQEEFRTPEADPGVPPELAKLGMSASDWEKIQSALKSDVSAGEAGAIPEEYRELVRGYFETISKKSQAK